MNKPFTVVTVAALLLCVRALAGTTASPEALQFPVVGRVVETTNAGGYTYVLVKHGAHKTWAASTQFQVAVGQKVSIAQGFMMKDFKSRILGKTFDSILFTGSVSVPAKDGGKAAQPLPPGHPSLTDAAAHPVAPGDAPVQVKPASVKAGSILKAPGGYTVEQCYSQKKNLTGKIAKVRGVVVKFTPEIMGRNWVHLQDGTGARATADLVFTTKETAKVGETIVVEGTLACDQDFGAGYKYAVLLEDATISR